MYFGHFLSFGGILVILMFQGGGFGFFLGFGGYFGHFLSFESILVTFRFRVFW